MVGTVTAAEFRDMLDADEEFLLVDTRPRESFEGWHVEGARHFPYKPSHEFDPAAFRRATGASADDRLVTVCAKGRASASIAAELEAAGYEDVTVVEGGMEAWSGVYDRVEVDAGIDAELVQLRRRAKGCLGYVLVSGRRAAVFDPTRHVGEFRAVAESRGAEIVAVLDTHVHADHRSGGRELADEVGAPYHLPAAAADRGVEYAFEPLAANEVRDVGGVDIKAVATPGHTSDAACYLLDAAAVLTGDTLFVESVGRTELQFGEGDARKAAETLYGSLHRALLAEPDSMAVLPGHVPVTDGGAEGGDPVASTVGELRTGLPILARGREGFVDAVTARGTGKPPNYEAVIGINRGVDEPESERAAVELELGPNRCAVEGFPEP